MTLDSIRKRNNELVPFDRSRIENAIEQACIAIGHNDINFIPQITTEIILALQARFWGTEYVPSVEDIQDAVELHLMRAGLYDISKHYITYRQKRIEERNEIVEEKIEKQELKVQKRDGRVETFDMSKVRRVFEIAANGHSAIDIDLLVSNFHTNIFDGIQSRDISQATIMTAKSYIEQDPQYSFVAAKLFLMNYYKDLIGSSDMKNAGFTKCYREAFKYNVKFLVETDHLSADLLGYDLDVLAEAINPDRDNILTYLSVQNLYDRYFIHHEKSRRELPQAFWMRVAMGLAKKEADKEKWAIAFYNQLSQLHFVSSTPTLFNSGTKRSQLSSCYLSTVEDDLSSIFKIIADDAQLSKWAGGLGNDWTNIRATGSKIKGTNGESQGVIPFLKIANDTAVAVNQGGKRKGALCAYIECWHLDFPDFSELRKNTGDERRRTHDMNTAAWIPDLFMKRVEADLDWTLFSPSDVPELHHIFGSAFERKYAEYEKQTQNGQITHFKVMKAKDLWRKILSMLFETGHPWITFKDPCNVRSPQDHAGVIHNSNLCTEITLNTSAEETAVCNLGSVNLARHMKDGKLDHNMLAETVKTGMRMLDNVVDINFYPTKEAETSNMRHRPVGLGIMGLADALYMLDINFDSEEAVKYSDEMMEAISYYAILGSSELARERGAYSSFPGSKWDRGILPVDTLSLLDAERGERVEVNRTCTLDWTPVRESIRQYGMRNSNTMAIAPTATISNIAGAFPCIEPIYKNLYVKSNLSGEFTVINHYLVADLQKIGLWDAQMVAEIKFHDGSIQKIDRIPQRIRDKYKEVFEISPEWVIKAAAVRGKWIDQSQSVNIFIKGASGKVLQDTYMMAWKMGLKTTYYLRTLGATAIEKSTASSAALSGTLGTTTTTANLEAVGVTAPSSAPSAPTGELEMSAIPAKKTYSEEEKVMCSIMNGGACEACQ
jgi:ribonucleoside-diphosphate reductase alpha chain